MSHIIDDERQKCKLNANCQADGLWYRIANVCDLKCLFYDKIENTHNYSMEAKDDHGSDGDV